MNLSMKEVLKMIRSYQKEDPVELDEVLKKAWELAQRFEVLSIERNMITMDVYDPASGWRSPKKVPGYEITVDTDSKINGKIPQVVDILALHKKLQPTK